MPVAAASILTGLTLLMRAAPVRRGAARRAVLPEAVGAVFIVLRIRGGHVALGERPAA